ncbi:MAG: hemolysin family protein [archaeon]
METWYISYLISLVVLVILSGFFSATEIAVFSINKTRIKALVQKDVPHSKALESIKNKPKDTLVAILLGNNIVNITASAIATVFFIKLFGNIGVLVATITMTITILTFGEIVPKSYATSHAEKISLKFSPTLLILIKILKPFIWAFSHLTKFSLKGKSKIGAEEELKALVSLGVEAGEMEKQEKEMIENVLQFNDITVKEVMTPRKEMIMLDGELSIQKAVKIMLAREFSRYPIYEGEKENIIGILHIKDALIEYTRGKCNTKLKEITNSPFFVPVPKVINELFKEFQDKRLHMAIVVNDNGAIEGLVTLEDLLEELVGEIIDESDVKKTMVKRIDKNTVLLHGMTELKDLYSFIHVNLKGKKTDTISSIILKKLKRIPKKGEIFDFEDNEIEIIEASPKQIIKLKLKIKYGPLK